MKKVMVLGAGRGQLDLIKAVKKYGYHSIVASIEGKYPGFDVADECCYVDISNPEAVLEKARELEIDAITTACLDTGIPALGYVCDNMNLSGLSARSAELAGDKFLMKSAFMEHNVKTARYKKISSREELEKASEELDFPLIIKAIDLQGSRGINIVHTKEDLVSGYEDTMNETRKDFCILEEFIEGYEFGAQAFVFNHKVMYVLPCGDITYLSKTNIPVGHYAPLDIDADLWKEVENEATKAIEALGLNNCAVNIDMILKDNQIYLIELTGRVGANCLPQLSSIYFGMDVYKIIIETALGNDPTGYFETTKKEPTPCYAKMLYSEKSGILNDIINSNKEDENITEVSFFVEKGDKINKFTNSKDCIGEVVVKGSTLEETKELIDDVVNNIEFVIE